MRGSKSRKCTFFKKIAPIFDFFSKIMGKYVNFTNSHFWRKLTPLWRHNGGQTPQNLIFHQKSLKIQWFFVRFSQNLAKNLNTDVKTFFEILSKKRAFYDVIMGVKHLKIWHFYDKSVKNQSFFIWFSQNLAKSFNTYTLTYFEILS